MTQHRRDILRITAVGLSCAVLLLLGAGGLVWWAAGAVDRIQLRKEADLVERRVERLSAAVVDDVHSATVWNDAVTALAARDLAWLQLNFGDYYADYMEHELTLVFDEGGEMILASRESEVVPAADVAGFQAAAAPLVAAVAREAAGADRRRGLAFEAVSSRSGVIEAEGKAWLVAVSTVVPEDTAVARPATDGVVVSAKPLSTLVDSMGADLKLDGARFQEDRPAGPAVPVAGPDGRTLGWLAWTPHRPGTAVVLEAAPYLAVLVLLLAGGAVGLVLWMGRVGRRLTEAEAALTAARDRAEAASEAKSRFLANMSHELRTPLNGVVAMGEIMAEGELSPIQRSHLDVLRASGQDLLKMIEHLLQVTRLERGQVLVELGEYDPAFTARQVAEARREAAQAKGLALELALPDLGERRGDGARVAQVLDYLIDNALTYTAKGAVRVTLEGRDDRVRFEVSDTGPGIPEAVLPTVFEVFTRGDDSLTSSHGGAGLGLSICRGLVEAMGGRIDVSSRTGEGARFTVDLPAPAVVRSPRSLAA